MPRDRLPSPPLDVDISRPNAPLEASRREAGVVAATQIRRSPKPGIPMWSTPQGGTRSRRAIALPLDGHVPHASGLATRGSRRSRGPRELSLTNSIVRLPYGSLSGRARTFHSLVVRRVADAPGRPPRCSPEAGPATGLGIRALA
jgi:hypothetical protein